MKTILIIEDDPEAAEMLQLFLEKKGFKVATTGNGIEGLSMVKFLKPNVIIVDLMIPGMDGRSLIDELRENIYTQNKLVIVVSGLIHAGGTNKKELNLPVEAAFPKPIDLKLLHETILDHIQQKEKLEV